MIAMAPRPIPEIRVRLGFRSGALKFAEAERIKTRVASAYIKALGSFIRAMEQWALQHVPSSSGTAHITRLYNDFIASLQKSINERAFVIGNPNVDYAGFVNDMRPVINWTKKGSAYQYFDKARALMPRLIPAAIMRAIRDEGLDARTGMTAGALMNKLFTTT